MRVHLVGFAAAYERTGFAPYRPEVAGVLTTW
jgi:hypothetical protein